MAERIGKLQALVPFAELHARLGLDDRTRILAVHQGADDASLLVTLEREGFPPWAPGQVPMRSTLEDVPGYIREEESRG